LRVHKVDLCESFVRGQTLRTSRVQYLHVEKMRDLVCMSRAKSLRVCYHQRCVRKDLCVNDCGRLNEQSPLNHMAKLEGLSGR